MEKITHIILLTLVLLGMTACTTGNTKDRGDINIVIEGIVLKEPIYQFVPFNPIPYWRKHLTVTIVSPNELKDNIIHIVLVEGWGSKAKNYYANEKVGGFTGTIIFSCNTKDMYLDRGVRKIKADKIIIEKFIPEDTTIQQIMGGNE